MVSYNIVILAKSKSFKDWLILIKVKFYPCLSCPSLFQVNKVIFRQLAENAYLVITYGTWPDSSGVLCSWSACTVYWVLCSCQPVLGQSVRMDSAAETLQDLPVVNNNNSLNNSCLVAKGPFIHHLQQPAAFKNQNVYQGIQKWPMGFGKGIGSSKHL